MNCPYCNILIEDISHQDYYHQFSYYILSGNWYLYLSKYKFQIGKRSKGYYFNLNDEYLIDLDPFDMKDSVKIIERFSKLLLFV